MTTVTMGVDDVQAELGSPRAAVNWVILAALLPVASLVTDSARLGDLYGRRRWFIAGMTCFGSGSALCGNTPNTTVLILGRTLPAAARTPDRLGLESQGIDRRLPGAEASAGSRT
jgi:MFS family permease